MDRLAATVEPVSAAEYTPAGPVVGDLPETAAAGRQLRRASVLAGAIVTVVFCSYCAIGILNVLSVPKPILDKVLTGIPCIAALLAIQLLYFSRPTTRLRSPLSHAMLLVQACLGYLPFLMLGQSWVGEPGFVAGAVLLVLRPELGWTAFAVIVATTGWIQAALSPSVLDCAYTVIGTALTGLEVFLLTRLVRFAWQRHRARAELAKGAAAEERLRFARDLHDLLGINLSAIALKAELTHRLLSMAPQRARQELGEIRSVTDQALSDIESVASGYRSLSLEHELRSTEALLTESGVGVSMVATDRELPVRVQTVLAAVLREGITNVVRHSDATRCTIQVSESDSGVALDIINDRPHRPTAARNATGNGIRNMSARVAEVGGTATAARQADGTFHLHADVPLDGAPVARGDDMPAAPEPSTPHLGFHTANTLLVVVLAAFGVEAMLHLLYLTTSAGEITVTAVSLAAVIAMQLAYFSRPKRKGPVWWGYALLVVQTVLTYLTLLPLRDHWVSLPGLVAANAVLILRRPAIGWAGFCVVLASVAVVHSGFSSGPDDIPFNVLATLNTGLVTFGLTWLSRLAIELDHTRQRLAEMTVAEQRLGFARDLHGLLGLSLSAIARKTQRADELLLTDEDRAAVELEEIRRLSREALADVRAVARGRWELSLAEEFHSVQRVLRTANVRVRLDIDPDPVPPTAGAVLAMVLREGATNTLQHSAVEHCEISMRRTGDLLRLEIINDGAPQDGTGADKRTGGGILSLTERVSRLGGRLVAEPAAHGRFRLLAELPVQSD